jgi:ketosteroid isomerase-like protein
LSELEHPNSAKVRELVGALQRGALETVIDSYTDDAVYRVGGNNLVSGNFQGHQEMMEFFVKLGELTGGPLKIELTDVMADDHHAVLFWTLSAEKQSKSLDATGTMAFKINDEGKFTESWFLSSDQRAYDEFYS